MADVARAVAEALVQKVRFEPPNASSAALARHAAASAAAAQEAERAWAAARRLDTLRARLHATKALAMEPNLPSAHLALGALEEPFTEASRKHTKMAREAAKDRKDPLSRLARAWARYEIDGDDKGTHAELETLYSHYPNDPEVAYRFADCLGDLWQVDKATAILERLLEGNPTHVLAMQRLFELRLNNNQIRQLLADGQRFVEMAPELPQSYTIFGRTLLAAGKPEEALRVLKQGELIDPDDVEIQAYAARTLLYLARLAEAEAIGARLAAREGRAKAAGLRTLGLVALLRGEFARGLGHLEASIGACPEEATPHMHIHKVIVLTLEALGEYQTAAQAAEKWREHALRAMFWSQAAYADQERDICLFKQGCFPDSSFRSALQATWLTSG